jgi:type II secretory pathway pseudopilin PulG
VIRRSGGAAGFTLIDALIAAAVILIVAGISIPQAGVGVDHATGRAAARFLAARMLLARTQAVGRGATVALVFERTARGVSYRAHQDGNRNGVRAAEIGGIDPPIEDRVLLFELFPGVSIGVTPTAPAGDPVRLGGTNILSFTPAGTSSSGTIYLRGRDGTQWGVRTLGATGRTRVLRYEPEIREWVNPL